MPSARNGEAMDRQSARNGHPGAVIARREPKTHTLKMKKRLLMLLLLLGPLGAAAQVRFETKSTDAVR